MLLKMQPNITAACGSSQVLIRVRQNGMVHLLIDCLQYYSNAVLKCYNFRINITSSSMAKPTTMRCLLTACFEPIFAKRTSRNCVHCGNSLFVCMGRLPRAGHDMVDSFCHGCEAKHCGRGMRSHLLPLTLRGGSWGGGGGKNTSQP